MIERPQQFPMARSGAGFAPLRLPGSIRRTTSIESRWPGGLGQPVEMTGRARDIATPFDRGAPVTLAAASFTITSSPEREILGISTVPDHPAARSLVGVRAGGASREALAHAMGEVRGTPLFQLIDDFAGASLVANFIWSHWKPEWLIEMREALRGSTSRARSGPAVNVCTGFAEGSSALDPYNRLIIADVDRNEVSPLEHPQDPEGWHAMAVPDGPQMRRARRIDLWRAGDAIRIDAGFQDSGNAPDGRRVALHEYRVHAVVDEATMVVRSLQALPLILPFAECPGASVNASRMIGEELGGFRQGVLERLRGTEGCTHLNDVLRGLADVPALAARLPA